MACQNLDNVQDFQILGNEPQPKVYNCKKTGDRFLCNTDSKKGDVGFWKLERGNGKCQWYRCQNPFIIKDGEIDYSDYSDCVITNYPYYNTVSSGVCGVKDINQGNDFVQECKDKNCCEIDGVCNDLDCIAYKTDDSYLVNNDFSYKCDGGSCVETAPGLGDYTNPFCDYQCSTRAGKKYSCINGICKEITDLSKYSPNDIYDNPLCDAMCKPRDDIGYICKDEKCVSVDKKDSVYSNLYDCQKKCGQEVVPSSDNKNVKKENYLPVFLVFVLNLIAIILILFFTSRAFNK